MKLPNVFANKIDKNINNNYNSFHSNNYSKKDIKSLKSYFDNRGYVNRLPVLLTMNDNSTREEKLVLCKEDHFITINNENIYFKDIKDYEVKK